MQSLEAALPVNNRTVNEIETLQHLLTQFPLNTASNFRILM